MHHRTPRVTTSASSRTDKATKTNHVPLFHPPHSYHHFKNCGRLNEEVDGLDWDRCTRHSSGPFKNTTLRHEMVHPLFLPVFPTPYSPQVSLPLCLIWGIDQNGLLRIHHHAPPPSLNAVRSTTPSSVRTVHAKGSLEPPRLSVARSRRRPHLRSQPPVTRLGDSCVAIRKPETQVRARCYTTSAQVFFDFDPRCQLRFSPSHGD